ncbi:preprotein translocase subunit YajC [Citrobacter farmeri]|uniref:Uncharacterized protein n=1 Tax=Citrobacter farmeri TaxID=67824 RepID=A0ACA8D1Q3_9ENTR|nr:hypothetical protein CI104_02330 [Citrobacter farmeri]MCP1691451.1 preprotein translocase subunit YajC [Citrobacter farmeri]MCW2422448.1 preprotein translocase subunit YajC [Citrobacter farmeri]
MLWVTARKNKKEVLIFLIYFVMLCCVLIYFEMYLWRECVFHISFMVFILVFCAEMVRFYFISERMK